MVSRRILASLVGAAAALVLGVTSAGAVAGGAVTYTGTVKIDNSNDGKYDPVAMSVSITIQAHRITGYQFFASLRCTDGSRSNVGVNYAQQTTSRSRSPITTSPSRWGTRPPAAASRPGSPAPWHQDNTSSGTSVSTPAPTAESPRADRCAPPRITGPRERSGPRRLRARHRRSI
jgi:hypothetical protein